MSQKILKSHFLFCYANLFKSIAGLTYFRNIYFNLSYLCYKTEIKFLHSPIGMSLLLAWYKTGELTIKNLKKMIES